MYFDDDEQSFSGTVRCFPVLPGPWRSDTKQTNVVTRSNAVTHQCRIGSAIEYYINTIYIYNIEYDASIPDFC